MAKARFRKIILSISDDIFPVCLCNINRPMKYARTTNAESHQVVYTAITVIKIAINMMPKKTYPRRNLV